MRYVFEFHAKCFRYIICEGAKKPLPSISSALTLKWALFAAFLFFEPRLPFFEFFFYSYSIAKYVCRHMYSSVIIWRSHLRIWRFGICVIHSSVCSVSNVLVSTSAEYDLFFGDVWFPRKARFKIRVLRIEFSFVNLGQEWLAGFPYSTPSHLLSLYVHYVCTGRKYLCIVNR